MRIQINQERAFAAIRQSSGQINRRGGFPDAAFLIRYRDDGSHGLLPPSMRIVNRADAIQQPGPYMWVPCAVSPLALGPLYVRNPF